MPGRRTCRGRDDDPPDERTSGDGATADDHPVADGPADCPPVHESALREMWSRADEVRAAELSTALAKLEASGDLTDSQRAELERLSRRLTAALVAPPAAQIRAAAAAGEDEQVRAALALFGATEDTP